MTRLLSLILAILLLVFLVACKPQSGDDQGAENAPTTYTVSLPEASADTDFVQFTMEDGSTFVIQLFPDKAPETVRNFKKLVAEGFYNGLDFYRLDAHMIQGGNPSSTAAEMPDAIVGEFAQNGYSSNTVSHTRGTISMVRNTTDYNSARCRFFIVHQDITSLDGHYAAFGRVITGMETVDAIASAKVTEQAHSHEKSAPVEPPVIKNVYFVDYISPIFE